MNNLFFISDRGCEASNRLILKLQQQIMDSIGGYNVKITKDKSNSNIRIFDFTSIYDGSEGNIFFTKDDSLCISKLNLGIFENVGVETLRKSFEEKDVIILNEIGFLESRAEKFTQEVFKILDSDKVTIGVVKEQKSEYLKKIHLRNDIIILKVNEDNIEEINKTALQTLKSWNVRCAK